MNSKKIKKIVGKCKTGDRKSQEILFNTYSNLMMGICIRYARSYEDAQDILHEGFIKLFQKIGQYNEEGPIEAWMRRVFVTTAINFYQRMRYTHEIKRLDYEFEEPNEYMAENDALNKLSNDELIKVMQNLSKQHQLILNLHVIEGYSHKEIGEMLNISEGASRSQLHKAKLHFKVLCKKNNIELVTR